MEKTYWIGRKRASHRAAKNAKSSIARLIHYDLAGRYSVKAQSPEMAMLNLALSLPQPLNADADGEANEVILHA